MEEIKKNFYSIHPSQMNEDIINYTINLIKNYINHNPDSCCEGYEEIGNIYLNIYGDVNKALFFYNSSININPNENGNKWMLIGQIQSGHDALKSFKKGIELFHVQLNNFQQQSPSLSSSSSSSSSSTSSSTIITMNKSSSHSKETREDVVGNIISAQCGIAELFMSDLCFENDAESQCENALQQAINLCENEKDFLSKTFLNKNKAQIYQTLSSVRISQQRPDDAKELIFKTVEIMLPDINQEKKQDSEEMEGETNAINGDNENGMEEDAIDISELYPYEFRVSTVRILIELNEIQLALKILSNNLLLEDDQVVEVWILLAQCHLMRLSDEEDDLESAIEAIDTSKEILKNLLSVDPKNEMLRAQEKRILQLEKQSKKIKSNSSGQQQNTLDQASMFTSSSSSSASTNAKNDTPKGNKKKTK